MLDFRINSSTTPVLENCLRHVYVNGTAAGGKFSPLKVFGKFTLGDCPAPDNSAVVFLAVTPSKRIIVRMVLEKLNVTLKLAGKSGGERVFERRVYADLLRQPNEFTNPAGLVGKAVRAINSVVIFAALFLTGSSAVRFPEIWGQYFPFPFASM